LTIYESENDRFPYALDNNMKGSIFDYAGNFAYDRIGYRWINHITEFSRMYIEKDSILWCPSRNINKSGLKNNVLCGNYGVNLSICSLSSGNENQSDFIRAPLNSSQISNPGNTLLLVDSGYSMISFWHAADAPPGSLDGSKKIEDSAYIPGLSINKHKDLKSGLNEDAVLGRHIGKTVNVGFVDGSVSCLKADSLLVQKKGDSYENIRPLWLPR
ncbi:hypothetical protein ACFLZ8_05320, partial [Planctomycetota bacterium]